MYSVKKTTSSNDKFHEVRGKAYQLEIIKNKEEDIFTEDSMEVYDFEFLVRVFLSSTLNSLWSTVKFITAHNKTNAIV